MIATNDNYCRHAVNLCVCLCVNQCVCVCRWRTSEQPTRSSHSSVNLECIVNLITTQLTSLVSSSTPCLCTSVPCSQPHYNPADFIGQSQYTVHRVYVLVCLVGYDRNWWDAIVPVALSCSRAISFIRNASEWARNVAEWPRSRCKTQRATKLNAVFVDWRYCVTVWWSQHVCSVIKPRSHYVRRRTLTYADITL